ncbi:hypothetical protein Tco_1146272 [Tanacetum coccineum]
MYSFILKQSYDIIAKRITSLVKEVMDFVDGCVTAVLAAEADYYPKLIVLLSEASNNLTKKLKEDFKSKIQDDCNEVIQFVKDRKESIVFEMESYRIYEMGSSLGEDTKLEHL